METNSTTLRWGVMFMAKFPEIQKRARQEIHEYIGRVRMPEMVDRSVLKYTDAVLSEVQRFATIVPLSIARTTTGPTCLGGYDLPDKTIIIPNLFAVHRDPELWPDPLNFNPDANFLVKNSKGEITDQKNQEYLIPFSLGKRSCPGETLAK